MLDFSAGKTEGAQASAGEGASQPPRQSQRHEALAMGTPD